MILKRSLTKWSQVISRNISYVQRARLLEKIKNDDDFCTQSLETGKFLLYNKGGGGFWEVLLMRGLQIGKREITPWSIHN